LLLALIVGIIALDQGQRRIAVQYSKRIVGRRMYGGQSTHIPMKVNQAGVIPVIFASVILSFPATLIKFINHPIAQKIADSLRWGSNLNMLLYIFFIIDIASCYQWHRKTSDLSRNTSQVNWVYLRAEFEIASIRPLEK